MKKTLSFLITGFSLFSFAQHTISPKEVTGIWKLKEAGFYENNEKVKRILTLAACKDIIL